LNLFFIVDKEIIFTSILWIKWTVPSAFEINSIRYKPTTIAVCGVMEPDETKSFILPPVACSTHSFIIFIDFSD
jgi:hypothetical protein